MAKRSKSKSNNDKWDDKLEKGRKIKDKFEKERDLPPVQAKTAKQKDYFNKLRTCNIVVCEGMFGTGKSFCSAVTAGDMFRKGEIEEIIVARPYVQTGKTAGFRPGNTYEKLYPYVRNVLDTVKWRLGTNVYQNALGDATSSQIQVQALEDIRGRSFDKNSFLLIEEAQQSTPDEMLSILTRISDNCTLVISGDDSQKDIKGQSGLSWAKEFLQRHNISGVGYVNFDHPSDIVRGGIVREIAYGLARDNGVKGF